VKKIFISTGEASGDALGTWYLKKQNDLYCEAVGGELLKKSGVKLYKHINELSLTGIWEIVKHIPFIFRFLKQLSTYIVNNNFEEVILVDFPGFNLMLAKRLKKLSPTIKITYLSPPQLWVWGAWRVKKIKSFCDQVIVIYPFEVNWYKQRGVSAVWLGYTFYEKVKPYFELSEQKEHKIAILPGSRKSEIENLLPYLIKVMSLFKQQYSNVRFVLPVAESFNKEFISDKFHGTNLIESTDIVIDQQEKMKALAKCCVAISKPGTSTLEIALLKVPTIIFYKTSYITYYIAKLVVKVEHMGLANLLLGREVSPELIQSDCSVENIFKKASVVYEEFVNDKLAYANRLSELNKLRVMLNKE